MAPLLEENPLLKIPRNDLHLALIRTNLRPEQFVAFYYNQFDSDRKQLAPLYVRLLYLEVIQRLTICKRDNSMLTFESDSLAGAGGIVEKLSVRNPSLSNITLLMNLLSTVSPIRES